MAVDEEVFTRCTDKNLVNLTPSERAEREETLSRLSSVFEGEKSLGSGTAGMTIAEYSPRRSYSNTLLRQSTDDKSSNSSFTNGVEYGSSETTLLNLDDHSNQSKDFGKTPTPTMELSNGGHVFEELGSISTGNIESEEKTITSMETPKRGRPRKVPGTTTKSSKRKESNGDSEISEDVKDEDETHDETEKMLEDSQHDVIAEREDDAASSEGTNRSETATPEPEAGTSVAKKTRAAARRKNTKTVDEEFQSSTKRREVQLHLEHRE
uniref:MLF1-interacting protein n=1 Tax=Caenorhabditis tropicalis TaxID=1561998 RepID=A0A1I7TFU6_9PELO